MTEDQQLALGLLAKPATTPTTAPTESKLPPRKFVRNWTMQDLTPKLEQVKSGRSYENGKAVFAAVSCIQCHRFNGEGGASGPDITGVGARFQPRDILESLIQPSKVISDQYQATDIITSKKKVFYGTVQSEDDNQVVLRPSPLATATETIAKSDISVRRPSKVSVMPEGLLSVLTENDVLDLLAYLRSAGNAKDPAFKQAEPKAPSATIAPSAP
jgi:putative heme-binding domain-containing protein